MRRRRRRVRVHGRAGVVIDHGHVHGGAQNADDM